MSDRRQRSLTTGSNDSGRASRLSLASISSSRSFNSVTTSLEQMGRVGSGRVRLSILKSPTSQSTLPSPAPEPSPYSWNPLASPLFKMDSLGLPSAEVSPQTPLRVLEPLPPVPNQVRAQYISPDARRAHCLQHYNEQKVYEQLQLSVAVVSPSPTPSERASPYTENDVELPALGSGLVVSPRQSLARYQHDASYPFASTSSSSVDIEEIGDDVLLPFQDRPGEVAQLMELSRNKWVFDQIRTTLNCAFPGQRGTSPASWTWSQFEAHILSPRSQVSDAEFVRLAEMCLRRRAEILWERFRTVLGIEVAEEGIEGVEPFLRSSVSIDPLFEGDALVDSHKACDEVQQRALQASSESPRSGSRRHFRSRSGGGTLSMSRSRQNMEPIRETEAGWMETSQDDIPASPSGSGRVLGLRLVAAPSSFQDLPYLARSISHGTDVSQSSSLADGVGFADDVSVEVCSGFCAQERPIVCTHLHPQR